MWIGPHSTLYLLLTILSSPKMIAIALSIGRGSVRRSSKVCIQSQAKTFFRSQPIKSGHEMSASSDAATVDASSGGSKRFKPKAFVTTPFQYHEEIVIDIEDLTNLGLGIGRYTLPDGRKWVVMVPLVLPGEKVKVKIFRSYSTYSEADLVEIIFSSPDRVKPQCEYFEICGGCQYQHMSIDAQRQWKKSQVESLLLRIGGLDDMKVNDAVGTSELFGYRTKITPHYDTPHHADKLKIGFQKRGTKVVIDIEQCMIATPKINAQYAIARENITKMVSQKLPKKGATLLFRDCDEGVGTDNRQIISQKVGGVTFKFQAGEFFQNNAFVLPLMVNHVLLQATAAGCTHLIDTYCGSGLFAISAAKHFDTVFGVEVSDLAVVAAVNNAKLNNANNVKFISGVSERIFSKVSHFPRDKTVIIIDPPRKGCDEPFLRQLFSFLPKAIVYVSCDPATQARDAKIIVAAGYSVIDVTPFDLFPQTRHIENVMTFVRQV